MTLRIEPGANELPITIQRAEIFPLLTHPSPSCRHRRHSSIIEARALRPDSGIENPDNGPVTEPRSIPCTTRREAQPQELIGVSRVYLQSSIRANRDDTRNPSQCLSLVIVETSSEAFDGRIVGVQKPRRGVRVIDDGFLKERMVPFEFRFEKRRHCLMRMKLNNVRLQVLGLAKDEEGEQ